MSITRDPRRFTVPDADDLRQLRLIAGLSIVEVAERGGWTPSTVQRWEQEQHSPRLCHVSDLLEIYADEIDGQQQLSSEYGL